MEDENRKEISDAILKKNITILCIRCHETRFTFDSPMQLLNRHIDAIVLQCSHCWSGIVITEDYNINNIFKSKNGEKNGR